MRHLRTLLFVVSCSALLLTQLSTAQLSPEQIVEKASPSIAMVLVGTSPTETSTVATALVIRHDGILVMPYHALQDARAIQVRFKSGEIFDQVQLLGVDQRRGVAAIKVNGSELPALSRRSGADQVKAADAVCVISHAETRPWAASMGIVSGYRIADEVPGAGQGYRLLQFTAPLNDARGGGVVVDMQGRALAIVVDTLSGGQNLHYAVPIESIIGLAESTPQRSYMSGMNLQVKLAGSAQAPEGTSDLPTLKARPEVVEKPAVVAEAINPADFPADPSLRIGAPELSEQLRNSNDPNFILRNFRTMYVDATNATFFGSPQMTAALGQAKEFQSLKITIVDSRALADVVLSVGYTFAWDYPYSLRHQNTSMILLSGKGSGPFSGPVGATSVANQLVRQLKPYRAVAAEREAPKADKNTKK